MCEINYDDVPLLLPKLLAKKPRIKLVETSRPYGVTDQLPESGRQKKNSAYLKAIFH